MLPKSKKQLDNEQHTIERYKAEAYIKGWRFMYWSTNGIRQYKHYECLTCAAAQDITPQNMRTGKPVCRQCRNNVYKDEAAKATPPLELLGPAQDFGHDGNYRSYRFACGHIQDIQLGAVRSNRFTSNEDTSWLSD